MEGGGAEVPEEGDWLDGGREELVVMKWFMFIFCGGRGNVSKRTMASRMKSVAALMLPAMRMKFVTLMHFAPGNVPAKVIQNPEIGQHWKMQTKIEDVVRQAMKMAQSFRMRRY